MTEHRDSRRLCIFARAPIQGRVKSRLAAVAGQTLALAAHIELVEGTLSRFSGSVDYEMELWIADDEEGDPIVERWVENYPVVLREQHGADLGQRMQYTLASNLTDGAVPILIGTDCPDIDHAYVSAAFEALEHCDVVLGPAEDGGYGLVGVKRDWPGLFTDVPWGTAEVLATTLVRARESDADVTLLKSVSDVDTIDDWHRYLAGKA